MTLSCWHWLQIKDEFSFITDFSYQLSNRYQRPVSSIAVTVNHSQCMLFGGSFDSAYTLIIHALPSLTQPTTNKRNAALIQKHIEETLGVKPARGYVRFVATPEDMVATGGRTIAGEIEDSGGNPTTDETESSSRKSSKGNRRISVKVCCWSSHLPNNQSRSPELVLPWSTLEISPSSPITPTAYYKTPPNVAHSLLAAWGRMPLHRIPNRGCPHHRQVQRNQSRLFQR